MNERGRGGGEETVQLENRNGSMNLILGMDPKDPYRYIPIYAEWL